MIKFKTSAKKIKIVNALPKSKNGAEIKGEAKFYSRTVIVENSKFEVKLTDKPVWIIERNLFESKKIGPEDSPFGFHPASFIGKGYKFAREIGISWDRYFQKLPNGIKPLKNITVAHDGMINVPGLQTPAKHWQIDNEPPRLREGYTDLVLITSKAIKEADPEAMKVVKQDLKKSGFPNIPVWFTEMGTYSGSPASRPKGEKNYLQSESDQAAEMIKRYTVAMSEGVKKIFWAWGMKEGFKNEQDNDFFDNTGFIYDGIGQNDPGFGTKKIIYYAHKKMTEILQYWDGNPPKRINTEKNVFAYRFCLKDQKDIGIIICWIDE